MSVPADTIHFNQSYMNYQYHWSSFPSVMAFITWFYMLPTIYITIKIIVVYLTNDWNIVEPGKNQYVFLVISLSQLSSLLYFLFSYMLIRLPATGLFTSYCAGIEPNKWLLVITIMTSYTNYLSMLYPFFMPIVRLVLVIFPKSHNKINSIIMRIVVPLSLVYPFCFIFFLFPAVGVCKQLSFPYPFGSIWIYYHGQAFGLRNTPLFLFNSIFWLISSILANLILFVKLARAREQLITQDSASVSYRAQVSISYTTIAMIVFYVVNGFMSITYNLFYGTNNIMAYSLVIRHFASDAQTCMVTWIFYKTHPVFEKSSTTANVNPTSVVFEKVRSSQS